MSNENMSAETPVTTNPLDTGEPFEVELLNPNPSSRRTKDGPTYRLSFEVKEPVHSAFMNAQHSNLRIIGYLIVVPDGDEQPAQEAVAKKIKEPKGPHNMLWFHLKRAGFENAPGVKEAIEKIRETPYEDPWKDLLHRYFGVGGASLATVSAADIFAKFPQAQFPQVHTIVQQALRMADNAASATA